MVGYLALEPTPHLVANSCTSCGAAFFDRRNACAACGASEFASSAIPTRGIVQTFTIVSMARPGVPVPFVAAVVDCDGTSVRANLVNVDPDAEHVHTGLAVQLTTVDLGADDAGTVAVGFGFEPRSIRSDDE
jgi:uncharacterized OB-fold protein